jgi:hypothetical protein
MITKDFFLAKKNHRIGAKSFVIMADEGVWPGRSGVGWRVESAGRTQSGPWVGAFLVG